MESWRLRLASSKRLHLSFIDSSYFSLLRSRSLKVLFSFLSSLTWTLLLSSSSSTANSAPSCNMLLGAQADVRALVENLDEWATWNLIVIYLKTALKILSLQIKEYWCWENNYSLTPDADSAVFARAAAIGTRRNLKTLRHYFPDVPTLQLLLQYLQCFYHRKKKKLTGGNSLKIFSEPWSASKVLYSHWWLKSDSPAPKRIFAL